MEEKEEQGQEEEPDPHLLLNAAIGYSNNATHIYNMYLYVLFGSLAFAAALPLRDIGERYLWCSSSSWLVGFSFLAFYFISFRRYRKSCTQAEALIGELYGVAKTWTFKYGGLVGFKPPKTGSDQVGFVIGAVIGLITFMWISNAERINQLPPPA